MNSKSIVNWENVHKNSPAFKKNKPIRYCFIEEFFERNFYEKLYETFPKLDDSWIRTDGEYRTSSSIKKLLTEGEKEPINNPTFSKEWNLFKEYAFSDEFFSNMSKFSGIKLSKVHELNFVTLRRGDFTMAHIDDDGKTPEKLKIMLYFTKNWLKGDPGGTYISEDADESSIIFEPYNLDNAMVCFEQGPKSWHGTRYITKDVLRQAIAIGLK